MTMNQWLLFFLIIQVIHFLGTWKLYVKAGRKSWEAIIPIYNAIVLMKIINRPTWWIILLFIPIINLLMFPVIWIETIRSFGKNTTLDSFLAVFTLGFYIYYVNYIANVNYVEDRSLKSRTELGEWVSSIVFAIVAATLVHTYIMQPYTIPTSSLEKSLLIGDFLFVSKFHYGARAPMTTVAAPMVHDSLPFTKLKSYLKAPQLPYFRIPGFQDIKRNEIVVFNWPADSLKAMWGDNSGEFTYKPIDKKTNYVKRCVAIPGDSLEIKDGYIYINGEKTKLPDRAKPLFNHIVESKSTLTESFLNKYNITEYTQVYKIKKEHWDDTRFKIYLRKLENTNRAYLKEISRDSVFVDVVGGIVSEEISKLNIKLVSNKLKVNITEDLKEEILKGQKIKSITRYVTEDSYNKAIFPHNKQYAWTIDNFGPIYLPEVGKTVDLNKQSLPFYKRIIEEYENNNLTINGDEIFINGKLATSYTFKQNYYWMMGDNRHNSLDARFWGYVPFDHVVGKPVFIWFSWNTNGQGIGNKIRWERVFTTVHGSGNPVSYLYYFLGALILWFGYSSYRKRKNAE